MKRVLITGSSGLLGPYLVNKSKQDYDTISTSRIGTDYPCDLTNTESVRKLIIDTEPDIVIHAAGYTDVDGCEDNPELAYRLNSAIVENITRELSAKKKIIYISTDQVYPDVEGLHKEGSEKPVNTYGKSKLMGEHAALKHNNTLVLRTNFFGKSLTKNRKSLSDFIIENLEDRKPITLFSDILFSPLHITTLASIIFDCIGKSITGTYNLGCRNGLSKSDFGLEIARYKNLDIDCATIGLSTSISSRADRTKDLRLDVSRIESVLSQKMPVLTDEIKKL